MLSLPKNSARAAIAGVGAVSAIFASWIVPLVCMFALSIRYRSWEAPGIGLFMDLLWYSPSALHGFPLFTIIGVCMVWMFEPMRVQFLID